MSSAGTVLTQNIRLELGKSDRHVRLFRNVTGEFWGGKVLKFDGRLLTLDHAQKVATGLFVGSHDLIGWRRLIVTQDMVGKPLAQFLSVEVKAGNDRPTTEQISWATAVEAQGGRAGFVGSIEDARQLVRLP